MMIHLPFSAHGLFFLSGAFINGSFFSFSSMNERILYEEKKETRIDQIKYRANIYHIVEYDCNPALKVYTTCEFYRGRILQKSSYRKYLSPADIKLTTHAPTFLGLLGHKKPDGQERLKGQRETGEGAAISSAANKLADGH